MPRLIPRELLPAASALNGITVGIMVMAGPALAGVLVAFTGYAWTYTIDVVLMLSLFLGLWTLPSIRPEGDDRAAGTRVAARRLAVPQARVEHPAAVHPRHHRDDLRPAARAASPRSAPCCSAAARSRPARSRHPIAVGAFLSSLFSGPAGRVRHHGLGIERAILVYGGVDRRRSDSCSARRRSDGSLPPTSTRALRTSF